MKKIAIFQSDLRVGGVQKSVINLLSNLDPQEYDVDLFVFDEGEFFARDFGENVHITKLPRAPIVLKYLPYSITYALYTPKIDLDKEYDVAVDFNSFWHECAAGAQKVKAKKRVMWLHSDVQIKRRVEFRYKVNWALSRGKFKRFDELVAVSRGVKESFYPCVSKKYRDMKISVIGNYIDTDEIFGKASQEVSFEPDPEKLNFVSVGRLSFEKGYDILLREFKKVTEKRDDVHLCLIGDGDERENLENLARELDIYDKITFLGNQPNPFPYEKKCDVFVLTSRYEGQGIVIWEAKALGLPVIISRHLEKYNDGITGYDDVAEAMLASAKNENKEFDKLCDYNRKVTEGLNTLFGND